MFFSARWPFRVNLGHGLRLYTCNQGFTRSLTFLFMFPRIWWPLHAHLGHGLRLYTFNHRDPRSPSFNCRFFFKGPMIVECAFGTLLASVYFQSRGSKITFIWFSFHFLRIRWSLRAHLGHGLRLYTFIQGVARLLTFLSMFSRVRWPLCAHLGHGERWMLTRVSRSHGRRSEIRWHADTDGVIWYYGRMLGYGGKS